MTDTTETDAPELPGADVGAAPNLQIVAQYLKDLSFENYNAPQSLMQSAEAPNIEVAVNLDAQNVTENVYEIDLTITATADRDNERVFLVEVVYGGLFQIQNVEAEAVRPVCLIECPRQLFPFARRIIADATRDGGFPPLLVDPIDFFRLYRERYGNGAAAEDAGDGSET
ncbi:MAG: protein-export chaperone SecB [Alphaproteobacteria bacterium]|jgi:preprotein translocase subunit SecB|nr:protein-export chaperone SecB [Alphaproteobacteria bacterium]